MADQGGPPTKYASPPWLQQAGTRVDEFTRRARFNLSGLVEPPEGDSREAVERRQRLQESGQGLTFDDSDCSPAAASDEFRRVALAHAMPASFSVERHTYFVLGRPCVVLKLQSL
jgi:hypothetical protein